MGKSWLCELEPLHLRLSLFGKPYFALNNRFAVFGRLGMGISSAMTPLGMKFYLEQKSSDQTLMALNRVYKQGSYSAFAAGGNVIASLGVEYFPFSRVGIAFEAGIRAEIFRASRTQNLLTRKTDTKAPLSFWYMTYEYPISLMLHIIL